MDITEKSTTLPHLSADFFLWLWYYSEHAGGKLAYERGEIQFWIEDRIAFRSPVEHQARTVVTGDNVSTSPEAKASLAAGKLIEDLRLHIRRNEQEYSLSIRGANLDLSSVKFPTHSTDGMAALLLERMALYQELYKSIKLLFQNFAEKRSSAEWGREILPKLRNWIHQKG